MIIQQNRYRIAGSTSNSPLTSKLLRQHGVINSEASGLREHAITNLNFSAHAHDRILKVTCSLADSAGLENINANHVPEAIQYRTLDRSLLT